MKKRKQIDSALLNDILRVTNLAKPQTILSIQSVIDEFHRFNMAKGLSEWTISSYAKETKTFNRSLVALEMYDVQKYREHAGIANAVQFSPHEERLADRIIVFIRRKNHLESNLY
ncbi:hypothetical protein [Sporosarcina sp. SG10008]|uniref:hypothetical protein n=1 Tax=Sporosarcina sp. SG10008 TaxID=3373103 RepID=UPI0037DCCC04